MARKQMTKAEAKRFVRGLAERGAICPDGARDTIRAIDEQKTILRIRGARLSYECTNPSHGYWRVTRVDAEGERTELRPLGLAYGSFRSMKAIKDELRRIHFSD